MRRLALTLSILALVACGETETTPTAETEAPAPVSAAVEAAAPEPAAPAATAETAPEVASCLDLIGQAKFQEALPVCLAALEIDPDNEAVQNAVAKARTETAKLAGSGEAAATAGEAAGQAGETAKGLTEKLGE